MAGITGRQVVSAFAQSNTWGVPASVTQQLLYANTTGMDALPTYVDDDAFTQTFIASGEPGDFTPPTPKVMMQLRFEQGCPTFLAATMGSAATPTVVSSQAAGSLVAYSHVITMASELGDYFTIANNLGGLYVQEIQTMKMHGFSLKTGTAGRIDMEFTTTANKTVYNSTTNLAVTVNSAVPSTPGNRAFRKNLRMRMNLQSAGALSTSTDEQVLVKDITLTAMRPTADADFVLNLDTIVEPDDDGFFTGGLDVTFARCNTVTANSIATALTAGTMFKGDLNFVGKYINSTSPRSILIEMPAMECHEFKAEVTGHNLLRPTAKFVLKLADSAPTGMTALVNPLRVTVVNTQATVLLA